MNLKKAQPFAKWTADKKELLGKLTANMPMYYGRYYEPFAAGGALLFEEAPKNAVISDKDEYLVNAYNQIKSNCEDVIQCMKKLGGAIAVDEDAANLEKRDPEIYGLVEKAFEQKVSEKAMDAECAALWLILNKVKGSVISEENLRNVSKFLNENQITIRNLDFEELCSQVMPGDFVYFNIPYAPEDGTENPKFTKADHERLVQVFDVLDIKGGILMLSNNNVELMKELYPRYNKTETNGRSQSNIAPDMTKRRDIIITNY